MKDFIKKALIKETTDLSVKLFKKYPTKTIKQIVEAVGNKYELNEDEQEELFLNTSEKLKNGSEETDTIKFSRESPLPFSIEFPSLEDMEKACSILMSRKLAWKVKGDDEYSFLQFDNEDDVLKAITFLKNAWVFIEKDPKKIASISFDNYEDFKKVYEFMRRNGMFIESMEDSSLSDDIDDEDPATIFVAKDQKVENIDSYKRKVIISKKWK